MEDARKAVQHETTNFAGALKWDPDTGDLYREQDYITEDFEPPTEKLDEAREELLHSKTFSLLFRVTALTVMQTRKDRMDGREEEMKHKG